VTWSMPTGSAQFSKCSMNDSIEWRGCCLVMVVWGTASMPMTPPFCAHASMTSSGLRRLESHRARAPEWVMKIGASLASMAIE
jgi:hypothetical protein